MIYVLDSSAMIALANNEPGANVVADLLKDQQHECCVHAINLCSESMEVTPR
jgi:uncharacterized protein with PIN domain